MDFFIIPDEDALGKCAWCHGHISDVSEIFGAGAKFKDGVDLSQYEGHCIQQVLVCEEKPICMMVTAADSEAKKDGHDGMFLLCSEKCGQKLKEVLNKEVSLANIIETVDIW